MKVIDLLRVIDTKQWLEITQGKKTILSGTQKEIVDNSILDLEIESINPTRFSSMFVLEIETQK